ncbi:MAG: phytanoyl-CoA dioxygenase family protein [Candidatus Latescibacteria bacterium]|nr:phytanoyl-CoA dioxygenase family protein [Candidatus Latescibacterota bacterium]
METTVTDLRKEYDEKGYVIARNAIDPNLAKETAQHVQWLIEKHPGVRPERLHLGVGIRPDQIDDTNAVDIELDAGDVSIHNPNIIHGSNANTSDQWRVGLTLRYIPTTTYVKKENHENILLRGKESPEVNNVYATRPEYISGEHMVFRGCEAWNQRF